MNSLLAMDGSRRHDRDGSTTMRPSHAVRITAAVSVLFAAPALLAAPEEIAGFPLKLGGVNTADGLLVVDADADGKLEIVVTAGSSLVLVGSDGKIRPGFPFDLAQADDRGKLAFAGAPTACDLNGDGKPEIVIAASNHRVYAVTGSGEMVAGFPVKLRGRPRGSATCFGEGSAVSVVLTEDDGNLVQVGKAGGKPKTLAVIGKGAESGVAVADLDGDNKPELIAVGGDSRVYVVDPRRRAKKKFSYRMSFRSSGVPAVGDINDDGRPEVLIASQDFKLHALDAKGNLLPGFPVATGYRVYAGISLGDLNGDGVLELVVGSGDKKVYAVNGQGKPIKGFPVTLDGRIMTDVALGDVDRDGKPEIAVVTQGGGLALLSARGKQLPGFPVRLGGKIEIAPAIADLDGDGLLDLIAQSATGELHAFKIAPRGKAEAALVSWGMVGHDPAHTGRFTPNPGRFNKLSYVNPSPKTTLPIEAKYHFFDADGDAETNTQIRWYLHGRHQADLNNSKQVPADKTTKHQKWSYSLQEGANFKAYGERGQLSVVFRTKEIEVANTSPRAPKLAYGPSSPATTATLKVDVVEPSTDPDNDKIEYRFIWLRDGRPQQLATTTQVIPSDKTRKNQEWRVVVVPYDGEVEGASASLTLTTINTPPGQPAITVAPKTPVINDVVAISIAKAAFDPDLDPLTYEYRYWINGAPLTLPLASAKIPARLLRKHQKIKVQVTAVDDEVAGGKTEAEFVVHNTPPPPPTLAVWPHKPQTAQGLRMVVTKQTADADADKIQLRHQWFLDGQPVTHPVTVPSTVTKKGQKWKVEVTPFDGEVTGKSVLAETTIENTPPTPPVIVIAGYELPTDVAVQPRVQVASTDDDGDPVRLLYRWQQDGKPTRLPETKTELLPSDTAKGQAWLLHVVPHDGQAEGPAATLRFSIRNSEPSTPKLALSHLAPTVRDRVSVRVTEPATDKDGDKLFYNYRWFRDGTRIKEWPFGKRALEPMEAKKDQQWRVEVRAYDGQAEGMPAIAEFRVQNHAPDPPVIALKPAAAKTTDDLVCGVIKPGIDPDKDKLVYHTLWTVDGEQVDMTPADNKVPAALTHKKQKWRCEVVAYDGVLSSKLVRSKQVVIANTPPVAPVVSIQPRVPTTLDDLVCQLDTPSKEADVDLVQYSYGWRVFKRTWKGAKNGQSNTVPASQTKRKQSWTCQVQPRDGEAKGKTAVAKVTIGNSPPTRPRLLIEPERPTEGQELGCKIVETSTDADRDKIRYSYQWQKDGVVQAFAPTSTRVPSRLVKARDMWKCVVTPNDGLADGPVGESPDVVVTK